MSILSAEADRLRASGVLGRSRPLNRLFDFLVSSSDRNQAPKEAEIALAVFDKDSHFNALQDASVRVYIHRLRSKLDQFYSAENTPSSTRIELPKGQYLLRIRPTEEAESLPLTRSVGRNLLPWIALAITLNLVVLFLLYQQFAYRSTPSALEFKFWSEIVPSKRPTLIIVGDYYIFGDRGANGEVRQLVRNFAINSVEDLEKYRHIQQDKSMDYVDLDLHYLPVGIAAALGRLVPILSATKQQGGELHILPMSKVTPEMLRNSNIVYVGYFSALGLLRDPIFAASNFEVGDTYDELVDKSTGRSYFADDPQDSDGKTPQKDYGYAASFPGPAGNRVIVISGTRDAALMQAAQSVTSELVLRSLSGKLDETGAAEALFEVTSFKGQNLSGQMVALRSVKSSKMWHSPTNSIQFPDELRDAH